MGLFGSKGSDNKARIEELKRKIQAEQAALADASKTAESAPAVVAAPVTPAAPVAAAPVQTYQPPVYQSPVQRIPDELFEEVSMEEIRTGIVLDLGEGMSLNLPIKSKMRLDEFLHIADKVRELQRVTKY